MANQFPTELNDWQDDEIIESGWADALETKIGKDDSDDTSSLDYRVRALEQDIIGEVPSGTVNGSNADFTLANTPVNGSTKLFLNGYRLLLTTDYTVSGSTITFVTAPLTDSIIQVDYKKSLA